MNESPRRSPLWVIFLTIFIDLVSFSIIFPLFPAMLKFYLAQEGREGAFGGLIEALEKVSGSNEQLAVLFGGVLGSLYSFLQFIFAPLWGSLSDKTGRRPVLIVTIAGMTLSYLLWFFSGSFALLVGARFLGGLMGGNISVATAAVADSTTAENRAKGMGFVGAAFGLGFILGPAIGGPLSKIDLTNFFPGLASFGVNPFSAVALSAFLLSLVNLIWVYTRFDETLSEADRGKAREEGRLINPFRLFRPVDIPGVNRANLVWFIYLLCLSGMEFTLTFLATEKFQYTPMDNAYMFIFVGLIIAFVQGGMIRQLAPLYGEKKLATTGLVTVIPGLALTGLASKQGSFYLGLGLMAFGSALVMPSLSALVSRYTPSNRQGSVLGIFRSLGALSRAVGPLFACVTYWRSGSQATYLAGAALLFLPVLLSLKLSQPKDMAEKERVSAREPQPSVKT